MAKRRLSDVLLESDLITAEDVERALSHQRTHGGYFGEALVQLGVVRRQEIEWALATQLDLPFIFPDAQSADPQATRLVPPDWALAHLAVPILHAGRSITVVVADPLDRETVDALRARTGLDVEMALATPARIHELIRAVYGARDAALSEPPELSLGDMLAEAIAEGADRIGVSVRGTRAIGWYTIGDRRERRRLRDAWEPALEAALEPSPVAMMRGEVEPGRIEEATLRHHGIPVPVDVRVLTSVSGTELLLQVRHERSAAPAAPGLPAGIRADLRLLAAAGNARVGVAGEAEGLEGTLPKLPELVLGDVARTAHVAREADLPGVYAMAAGEDPRLPALLEAYAFDALTVDLPLGDPRLPAVLAAAPLSFARVPAGADPAALERAGIGWVLTVSAEDQGRPTWELHALNR